MKVLINSEYMRETMERPAPTERDVLDAQLRSLEAEKRGLEEQLRIESQDGEEPIDAEDIRAEIARLSSEIETLQRRIQVIDGTRIPNDQEGQGEMFTKN